MKRNSKSSSAAGFSAVMTVCFLLAVGYIILNRVGFTVFRPTAGTAATTAGSVTAPAATATATVTASAASPVPSPTENPGETELLQIRLAAAETEAMLRDPKGTAAPLEDRTTYDVPVERRFVYLTFDDGPSAYTPKVLEILKKNGIKATFFVEYNPVQEYYRQIAEAGHTLALHTYTHDYKQVYASEDSFFSDLDRISGYVEGITGVRSNIVRLAGGSSNTISRHYSKGVITRITQDLDEKGYVYFDWNAQCMDATTPGISPEDILKNVRSFTTINGVAKPFVVLLLHNGKDEPTTPDALQSIIDYYRGLGYTFEQITKDTPAVHQPVQN